MLRGHFPRSTFRGLGWFLNLAFVSESFVQELNGTPRDTKGSSFVLNPSVLTLKGLSFTLFSMELWKKSGFNRRVGYFVGASIILKCGFHLD
jgi:hypothetical protein